MSRPTRYNRARLEREIGGARNAVRAEQLRAVGLSDRAVARRLDVPVEAVCGWFSFQDALAFSDTLPDDVGGAA